PFKFLHKLTQSFLNKAVSEVSTSATNRSKFFNRLIAYVYN
ncbi:16755_t:CDS:1, partial [Racocetra persica]